MQAISVSSGAALLYMVTFLKMVKICRGFQEHQEHHVS